MGKEVLTIENLEKLIAEEYGVNLYYDVVTNETFVIPTGKGIKSEENLANIDLPYWGTFLSDKLKGLDFTNCTTQKVEEYLSYIANKNKFNSVKRYLKCGGDWDGKSRLDEVFEILNIQDDALSKTLVKKWLMQCICILENNLDEPFGCDGILILQGSQGIGKTSFFRKIACESRFFKEGKILNPKDKDSIIACTSSWIVEMGEFESSLKSEISALKAFTTDSVTEVRKPYARTSVKTPRLTSLCGTCNSTDFLKDETGNRRFWVVPVNSIDFCKLDKLNVVQLWKEIQSIVADNFQSFRLTSLERMRLEERNSQYCKKVPAQAEIEDIFTMAETEGYYEKEMTVTSFKRIYQDILGKYTTGQVGKALKALGVESRHTNKGTIVKVKIHQYKNNDNVYDMNELKKVTV